jgi:hypothetical protein
MHRRRRSARVLRSRRRELQEVEGQYAFVITAKARETSRRNPDAISIGTTGEMERNYDWFTPDTVKVAEYYEVEDRDEKRLILTHRLSQARSAIGKARSTRRRAEPTCARWAGRSGQAGEAQARPQVCHFRRRGPEGQGVDRRRPHPDRAGLRQARVCRRHRAVQRLRAGPHGPQAALQHRRCRGSPRPTRRAPRDIPIFASQQMPPHLRDLWARQVVDRHAYAWSSR